MHLITVVSTMPHTPVFPIARILAPNGKGTHSVLRRFFGVKRTLVRAWMKINGWATDGDSAFLRLLEPTIKGLQWTLIRVERPLHDQPGVLAVIREETARLEAEFEAEDREPELEAHAPFAEEEEDAPEPHRAVPTAAGEMQDEDALEDAMFDDPIRDNDREEGLNLAATTELEAEESAERMDQPRRNEEEDVRGGAEPDRTEADAIADPGKIVMQDGVRRADDVIAHPDGKHLAKTARYKAVKHGSVQAFPSPVLCAFSRETLLSAGIPAAHMRDSQASKMDDVLCAKFYSPRNLDSVFRRLDGLRDQIVHLRPREREMRTWKTSSETSLLPIGAWFRGLLSRWS
jgi:hypothetical protein